MASRNVPFRKTVFVCTHTRGEGRVACANPGRAGAEVCRELKEAVKAAGLKGKVRVARSGCLDLCEQGPNLFIYPDQEWMSGVTTADVPRVLEKIGGEKE